MPVMIEPPPVARFRPTRIATTPWASPPRLASLPPAWLPGRIPPPSTARPSSRRDELVTGAKLHPALLRW